MGIENSWIIDKNKIKIDPPIIPTTNKAKNLV